MKRLLIVACIFSVQAGIAQVPATLSSAEIYQGIQKLNVLGNVLYVAAHPDDENTRLLAYLAKEKQYRTGYLSLTRGDGGQNLIGDEQGIGLGLIRTQELLAARRVDGAEQFFTRAYDFGYSKTADETLRIWGKEKILSDVVWVIRKFRPDVIITRFPGDSRAGHGHHWASALLANEAFTAAADPRRFPEHFQYGVEPWQAKRIMWNAFIPGGNAVPDSAFRLDVGAFNPLIGKGYGEIASESRSNHKSQGFGAARTRGQTFEYFFTTGGEKPTNDLFDGVNTAWSRTGASFEQQVNRLQNEFSFEHPERSVKGLVELYRSLKQMKDGYWKDQKMKEVQQLIESASGLFADAVANTPTAIRGDSLKITLQLNNRNGTNVIAHKAYLSVLIDTLWYKILLNKELNTTLPANINQNLPVTISVPANTMLSQPYWLTEGSPNGSFQVSQQTNIGKPENSPAFEVRYFVDIEGESFDVARPVQYKYTDPVKGEVYQPIAVRPRSNAHFDKDVYVAVNGNTLYPSLRISAGSTGAPAKDEEKTLRPTVTGEWTPLERTKKYLYPHPTAFAVRSSNKKSHRGEISLPQDDSSVLFGSVEVIEYDHIPRITYFSPAKATLVNLDVKTSGKKVGYITGAGDKVPEAIESMGYELVLLAREDITADNIKQFDAIIAGIRAYNVHPWLAEKHSELMQYVKNGGNLIVQYNTNNFVGPLRSQIGPYNFSISRSRVSEEDAKVNFVLPDHPSLNFPNKITQEDFLGWVQERSVYEADQLDTAFVTPLSMNDTNEKPGRGSLVIAPYGKGNFVYTGLSFFRQLPAGVPGAYRLLANLIALPKHE